MHGSSGCRYQLPRRVPLRSDGSLTDVLSGRARTPEPGRPRPDPGVKRGAVLERTCWITDVVPTIRYLTGLPMPRHAEGAVVYQAREDPEAKFKELDGMKRAYERMKKAYGETGTLIC